MKDPNLSGILISGQFKFLDGHIYHKNEIIKVRYDLIGGGRKLTQEELFDFYPENLPLREGMKIGSDAILICEIRHRMGFIAEDIDTQKRCSIVRIMPFLHERRLYFDADTPGRYLMSSMQLKTKSRNHYNSSTCQCLTGATSALTYSD